MRLIIHQQKKDTNTSVLLNQTNVNRQSSGSPKNHLRSAPLDHFQKLHSRQTARAKTPAGRLKLLGRQRTRQNREGGGRKVFPTTTSFPGVIPPKNRHDCRPPARASPHPRANPPKIKGLPIFCGELPVSWQPPGNVAGVRGQIRNRPRLHLQNKGHRFLLSSLVKWLRPPRNVTRSSRV